LGDEAEQNLHAYGSNQVVVGYISKNAGSEMKVTKALTTHGYLTAVREPQQVAKLV